MLPYLMRPIWARISERIENRNELGKTHTLSIEIMQNLGYFGGWYVLGGFFGLRLEDDQR